MNALMHAEMYGRTEVAQYLRSLGVEDLRDTTPADYPAAHARLLEIMGEFYGELARFKSEDLGEPTVTIYATKTDKNTGVKALFTVGMSDRNLDCGEQLLICTELMLLLPASWRLSKSSWPVRWLHQIARQSLDGNCWPDDRAAVFPNGDPPQPLADDTKLSAWLGLVRDGAQYQMPDTRWVEVRLMIPICASCRRRALSCSRRA